MDSTETKHRRERAVGSLEKKFAYSFTCGCGALSSINTVQIHDGYSLKVCIESKHGTKLKLASVYQSTFMDAAAGYAAMYLIQESYAAVIRYYDADLLHVQCLEFWADMNRAVAGICPF